MERVKSIRNNNLKDELLNQDVQFQNLTLLPISCVIWGKFLKHSEPKFPHLKNVNNHGTIRNLFGRYPLNSWNKKFEWSWTWVPRK